VVDSRALRANSSPGGLNAYGDSVTVQTAAEKTRARPYHIVFFCLVLLVFNLPVY
jgi:hypothetical protein